MKGTYFDKDNIVNYIIQRHMEDYGFKISPLKLQKTLYLLYAMWAGNAILLNEKIDISGNENVEYTGKFNIDIFEPQFEAWEYGPVDRGVYFKFKKGGYTGVHNIVDGEQMGTIYPFVNSILGQTFKANDFALVKLTHKDKSWIDVFNIDPTGHSKILKNSIIKEYSDRLRSRRDGNN